MQIPLTPILAACAALAAVVGLVLLAGRLARTMWAGRLAVGHRLVFREVLALDRTRRLG